MKGSRLYAAFGAAMLLVAAAPVTALPLGGLGGVGRAVAMSDGAFAVPPLAATRFCLQNPGECRPAPAERVALDDALWSTMLDVNARVNATITPREDGAIDDWRLNQSEGDCDEYAVQKRHDLAARGVPLGALRLATVVTAQGNGHLVLVVTTDRGDFVLDNLREDIRPWNRTGHRFVARQSAEDPRFWQTVVAGPRLDARPPAAEPELRGGRFAVAIPPTLRPAVEPVFAISVAP